MNIQTLLRKKGFSVYRARTGTEYWAGLIKDKEVLIRISNHPPQSSFIDDIGDVQYRDEPDFRIDPEQDDTEIIKKLLRPKKESYIYLLVLEDWNRPKNRYRIIAGRLIHNKIGMLEIPYKIISYKEYLNFKKEHQGTYYFT